MGDTGSQSAGKLSLAWLAGFYDGEGCLFLGRKPRTVYARVILSNTDHPSIERASEILKEHRVGHFIYQKTKKGYRPSYHLNVDGIKRVQRWLDVMEPYLVTKAAQATVLRQFVEYRLGLPRGSSHGEYEERMRLELSELKR